VIMLYSGLSSDSSCTVLVIRRLIPAVFHDPLLDPFLHPPVIGYRVAAEAVSPLCSASTMLFGACGDFFLLVTGSPLEFLFGLPSLAFFVFGALRVVALGWVQLAV